MKIGQNTVIEDGVLLGAKCSIGHNCVIRQGAVIGFGAVLGDGVHVTGPCVIGDYVNVRTGSIISRGVIIEDGVFVGPRVVTNHSIYPDWLREEAGEDLITYISGGSMIGSGAVIGAGLWLGPYSIVGAGAVVVKDFEGFGVLVGCPAKKTGAGVPAQFQMVLPGDVGIADQRGIRFLRELGYVWGSHEIADSLVAAHYGVAV